MATKKVARAQSRSTSEGKTGKAPAEVLTDAKAREAAAVEMPFTTNAEAKAAVAAHAVAGRDIDAIRVPMSLRQLCALLGRDIEPGDFAASALASVADQIETLAVIVDTAPEFSSDSWRLFQNLADRATYASHVARWLSAKNPKTMPEAQS